MKVKIHGAGSLGNHLANASRQLGWDVTVCDVDPKALERMKKEIYPQRYIRWDDSIRLAPSDQAPKGGFDYVLIATPPESHMSLATEALSEAPRAILMGTPACPPSLEGAQALADAAKAASVRVFVGHHHAVGRAAEKVEELVVNGDIGKVVGIDVEFREHWEGLLQGPTVISTPKDSRLGFWERGGGAGGEHSHAIHLWQHFARVFGHGRVVEAEAMVTYVEQDGACYDSQCLWNLRTEKGLSGRVAQDLFTKPHRKRARIQGETGYVEWAANYTPDGDAVFAQRAGAPEKVHMLNKKRADDFIAELRHIWSVLDRNADSPISLERGLDAALLVAAAHTSEGIRGRVRIDPAPGWTQEALTPCQ